MTREEFLQAFFGFSATLRWCSAGWLVFSLPDPSEGVVCFLVMPLVGHALSSGRA
jgi:hypothetical protein